MKNYILDSAGYALILEGRGGAGTAEDLINLGRIKMPDKKVVEGGVFVDAVNSAMAFFESKYPYEYSFISDSPVIYLLDNSFCDTMCVDGRGILYINIGFIYKKPPEGLGMHPKSIFNVLYHECMHVFLSHISRTHAYNKSHNKNKLTWRDMNIAGDLEVNGMMVLDKVCDSVFFETTEGCYAKDVAGLPMEAIASNHKDAIDRFKRKLNEPPKQDSGVPSAEQGDQSGKSGKDNKGDQSDQSDQSDKDNKGDQSGKSDKDNKGDQSGKSDKDNKGDQSGKPDKDNKDGRSDKDGKSGDENESGQSDKGDKPENGGEFGNGEKGEDGGKPENGGDSGDGGTGEDGDYDHEFDDTPRNGNGNGKDGEDGEDGNGRESGRDGGNVKSTAGDKSSGGGVGRGGSGEWEDGKENGKGDKPSGSDKSGNDVQQRNAANRRRIVGEIVRESEVAEKLPESLRKSGFDESAIDRIRKIIESTEAKSEETLTKLRDDIVKSKPDSALSKLCTDVKISETAVEMVWEEIVKKFLEHNTLMAGSKKKVPDRKIRWGDRRTIAHDMMRPYHPKTDSFPQNINVLVDTSGSVDSELVSLFAQTIAACCDKLRYTGVLLLPFAEYVNDNAGVYIKRDEVGRDPELVVTRVAEMCTGYKAGKATFITPCVQTILKYSKHEPRSVWIIFTDGEFGDYMSLKGLVSSSKRILFVIYNKDIKKLMGKGGCLEWCMSPYLSRIHKCYVELNESIVKEQ